MKSAAPIHVTVRNEAETFVVAGLEDVATTNALVERLTPDTPYASLGIGGRTKARDSIPPRLSYVVERTR